MKVILKKPPILASVFLIIGLSILCSLGWWQYQRLQWKQGIIADMETERARDASPYKIDFQSISQDKKYIRGFVSGRFIHDRGVFIQPRVYNRTPGYHVFTPFLIEGGDLSVLVNRGWVPLEVERPEDFQLESPQGPITLKGMMVLNEAPNRFVPQNNPAENIWFRIDLEQIAAKKGVNLFKTHYFHLETSDHDGNYPIAEATKIEISNNHAQYMIFWFTMALVLLGVFCARFIVKCE